MARDDKGQSLTLRRRPLTLRRRPLRSNHPSQARAGGEQALHFAFLRDRPTINGLRGKMARDDKVQSLTLWLVPCGTG
jgi:hypothetical protein